MDEEKNKDVEGAVENTTSENTVDEGATANVKASGNKSKVILFSVVGVVALIFVIVGIVVCANVFGKPSKNQAKKLAQSYISAINDKDDDALIKLIDADGYVIFKEEKESKFDSKYKDRSSYIKKYLDKNNIDDREELEEKIAKEEINNARPSYYEYSFKEITDIKKSSKSSKIIVIKAKVSQKTSYDKESKVLRLYVMKVSGKYKVIGSEIV